MDAENAREFFRKYQTTLEELWLEKQLCRNLVLDSRIMSESELDSALATAKKDPDNLRQAAELFASSRKALAEFGLHDTIAKHLASKPPAKGKQN